MRITARGWRRDAGAKTICEFDIEDAKEGTGSTYKADIPYMSETSSGAVELKIGPQTLTLGGEYQVIVRLTKDDIARLFLETHPEVRTSFALILGTAPAPIRFRPRGRAANPN